MNSFLIKLKSLIPITLICVAVGAISYGWYWHSQYNKSQATIVALNQQLATSKASQELLESSVQRWKAAAAQYDKQLKRKEALVAKRNTESNKRVQTILQTQYPSDCNQAIQKSIQDMHVLGFT